MKIKGTYCLFFILSVCFSQALAFDLSYKSDIPVDNKPSEEYLTKRNKLDQGSWDTEKLAEDNALAEKRENELKEYNKKFNQKNGVTFSYDWNEQHLKAYPHIKHNQAMQHLREQTKRHCYRTTKQKLEKEQGNGYSYADIADSCGYY
ncbi:hypothetical protein [Xenorhabdus sp. IM139775]|uniref:hypothetical protein n=1 Tax=Xenorhabdus sp. IM139775 TaxID=3025876 RepID=UPI0023591682|nr:hypothetical protein [Xenorhabdus sp. IM139775]MDC9593870.1 hypothetical protein [Xenorhabdus sp. IM139775]